MEITSINWWKVGFVALMFLAAVAVGFFLGRSTIEEQGEPIIKYLPGERIYDTTYVEKPIEVIMPVDTADIVAQCVRDGIYSELFPEKIKYIEVTKKDTTEIMKDWAAVRKYEETIFNNDTLGVCKVSSEVQYNRLKYVGYEFQPVTKTVTVPVYKIKKFTPFVGIGVTTMPSASVEAGYFINQSWGLSVEANYNLYSVKDVDLPNWTFGVKFMKEF